MYELTDFFFISVSNKEKINITLTQLRPLTVQNDCELNGKSHLS